MSRKRSQTQSAAASRWKVEGEYEHQNQGSSSDEEFSNAMNVGYEEERDESEGEAFEENFKQRLDLGMICDMFVICKRLCGSRKLSVLIYTILRHIGLDWRYIDDLLKSIGAYRCESAHKWADVFISDNIEVFENEGRGGKHHETFYDIFPELESEAKRFTIESCSRKSADFTVTDLTNFIDTKFYELTQTTKFGDALVRSLESCRLDLRRWGAKFQPNTQRPYFEGHERQDVVAHRQEFISYFLQRKNSYYTISDGDQPVWQNPSSNPTILICK